MNNIINKLLLKIISGNYSKAITRLNENQFLTLKEIRTIQNKKLIKLIHHCQQNVPYYSKLLNNCEITYSEDLQKLPFLTKDKIRNNIKSLKATNLPAKRFKPNSTSGSTGQAMKFYFDRKTDVVRHACAVRCDSWTGWKFGELIIILWNGINVAN